MKKGNRTRTRTHTAVGYDVLIEARGSAAAAKLEELVGEWFMEAERADSWSWGIITLSISWNLTITSSSVGLAWLHVIAG